MGCLTPDCGRFASKRGVCVNCYQAFCRAIKRGETDWERLESEGRIASRKRSPKLKYSDKCR